MPGRAVLCCAELLCAHMALAKMWVQLTSSVTWPLFLAIRVLLPGPGASVIGVMLGCSFALCRVRCIGAECRVLIH